MNVREDLLELTLEALTVLANAGFVKRAQKELAAGQLPRLEVNSEGAVTAHFDDGVRTHLAPGRTLRDADCNCQASGMCRHRVLLVLTYQSQQAVSGSSPQDAATEPQDGFWSPAEFDDAALALCFPAAVLSLAERLAAERPVLTLHPAHGGQAPLAQLPMSSVRFFSRSALVHARCDCKMGSGCAHVVLAVWAFREAARLGRGAIAGAVEVPPRCTGAEPQDTAPPLLESAPEQAALAQMQALLQALWLDGSSQPLAHLAPRLAALHTQVLALGWCWVADALDELRLLLQAQQARSSRFDPQRLLLVVTELWARLRAAKHVQAQRHDGVPAEAAQALLPASQVLGLGIKGEVELDHLKLVSLGAVLWSDEVCDGADVLLADPDTQTVSVLAREWPRAEGAAAGAEAVTGRRVAGFPLRQLAAGQVITPGARRRANGRIDIASGAQTGVMPLSPTAWDGLQAPLRQTSVSALIDQLRRAPPDFVRPRQAANGAATGAGGQLHVVSLAEARVVRSHWDAAAQVLHAALASGTGVQPCLEPGQDGDEPLLFLALPHRSASPHAVDALARALAGEWGALRALAGPVQLQGGRAVMHPLALLTVQRGVVLQVEAAAPQSLTMTTGHEERPPLVRAVTDTSEWLAQWLRQGLRHQTGGSGSRLQAQTQRLEQAGLRQCARLLATLTQQLQDKQREHLTATLSTLVLLLQALH